MYATEALTRSETSDTAAQSVLEVRNLAVSFAVHGTEVAAVRDVSFKIPRGKTVALVGESGSGKSVTAQAILGILPTSARISDGEILFHDQHRQVDIAQLAPASSAMRNLRGDQISIIFQEPMVSLSPVHKLLDQIGEALRLHRKVSAAETRQAVLSMLEKTGFPDPEKALNQYPFELSGGLRQRAMIAMALICQPALLIADEPTTALDVTVQAQILQLIKSLQAEFSMSVLLITHDLGVVANMADDVVVMFHGEVVERGPIRTLFRDPQHPYLKALFAAIPSFDMADGARLTSLRPVTLDSHYVQAHRHRWSEAEKQAAPHLSIQGLGKDYHSRHGSWQGKSKVIHAVRDFSLDIPPGESFGLVGESGCGKTTLCKMLMRAVTPSRGKILYNDRGQQIDLLQMEEQPLRQFRQKMQFVFQDPFSSLSPRMTVLDILCEPFVIHGIGNADFRRQRAKELMNLVGLDNRFLNRYPHSFSGGQRQRISIARALALEPDLLILDEPVSALDVSVQAQILNLLKDLQQNLGLTYLFISHNLAVVDYIADRIGVMCQGQLVEVAPRHTLFRQPLHPYTHALLAAIPYAELERPLDYSQLDRKHMDPTAWPGPYQLINDDPGLMREVSPGHLIREASR